MQYTQNISLSHLEKFSKLIDHKIQFREHPIRSFLIGESSASIQHNGRSRYADRHQEHQHPEKQRIHYKNN